MSKWSIEEEEILRNNYPKEGAKYCCDKLNRSKESVVKKAIKLGIKYVGNNHYEETNFRKLVAESYNVSDMLRRMGITVDTNNYRLVRRYLELYQIDTSHFRRNTTNQNTTKGLPISELLVIDSRVSISKLKKLLIKEGLLEYKCAGGCGVVDSYNGKTISLHLDHINGNPVDNRLENLRLLCPNCHSQTDTYCGKNQRIKLAKTISKCSCGNDKSPRSKQCSDCNKREMPPLEELVASIKSVGYLQTGKVYNVSDNAIRKWIIKYNLNPKDIKKCA